MQNIMWFLLSHISIKISFSLSILIGTKISKTSLLYGLISEIYLPAAKDDILFITPIL